MFDLREIQPRDVTLFGSNNLLWNLRPRKSRSRPRSGMSRMLNLKNQTGFQSQNGNHLFVPGELPGRPLSQAWMTDELIAETQRVWSPYYGRDLTPDEAVEILRNVKRFAELAVAGPRDRKTA